MIDALRVVHSGQLQQVMDIVMSHQGVALKSALLQRVLSALVLPAPERYRPQLRRLAALSCPGAADVAAQAQALLEHSLLGELRTLVARALSGLDMFSEPHFAELFAADSPLLALSPASAARAAAGGFGGEFGGPRRAPRRPTVAEGLYSGLGNLALPASREAGVEAKMAMLVEAPAAVEDAIASLLDHTDDVVQVGGLGEGELGWWWLVVLAVGEERVVGGWWFRGLWLFTMVGVWPSQAGWVAFSAAEGQQLHHHPHTQLVLLKE